MPGQNSMEGAWFWKAPIVDYHSKVDSVLGNISNTHSALPDEE